jgi:hypothetical protein
MVRSWIIVAARLAQIGSSAIVCSSGSIAQGGYEVVFLMAAVIAGNLG